MVIGLLVALGFGAVFEADDGEVVTVPLNQVTGTVVHLPQPVRMVTPSKSLEVVQLEQGSGGVQYVQVQGRPGVQAEEEVITFVLADGRSVGVRFQPTGNVDNYVDIRLPVVHQPTPVVTTGWLVEERAVMAAMLVDDPGRRVVVDEEVTYAEYPELVWRLRRKFPGAGATGYVFELRSDSRQPVRLDVTALAVDRPNRIALIQSDHEVLEPCSNGDESRCATLLRLVLREPGGGLGPAPVFDGGLPFAVREVRR